MADLFTVAAVAEIVGGAAVVGGVAFGVVQLRQYVRQRQDAAAFAFIQQWDPATVRHMDRMYGLPDGAPPGEIDRDPGLHESADAVYLIMEKLGILVHNRVISLETANEWAGGVVRVTWRKLAPWIRAKRERAGSERPGEWFQWLAERFAELPARDERVGAHVAKRHWRP
ncbi:MAG: DUF4760 domain-containing protein [Methanobacteriota archaeon]